MDAKPQKEKNVAVVKEIWISVGGNTESIGPDLSDYK